MQRFGQAQNEGGVKGPASPSRSRLLHWAVILLQLFCQIRFPPMRRAAIPPLPRAACSRAALQEQNYPYGPAQAAGPLNFSVFTGPILPQGGVTATAATFLTCPCDPHPEALLRGGGSTQNFSQNREASLSPSHLPAAPALWCCTGTGGAWRSHKQSFA